MRTLFGTVLSIIAVGVLLIAYGLLSPRAAAAPFGVDMRADAYQLARPIPASERVFVNDEATPTAAVPQLLVRCEPGQRALIRQMAGAAVAECVDGAMYGDRVGATRASLAYPASDVRPVRTVQTSSAPRRTAVQVERSGRDWKKTAMVIGGTTAAGAGVGAIFGGKKGALIGAAIGGGAGTIYEVRKR